MSVIQGESTERCGANKMLTKFSSFLQQAVDAVSHICS